MWTDVGQRKHELDKVLIGANWQRYTHTHTKRGGGDAGIATITTVGGVA